MSSLSLMLRSASPEREGRLAPPEREGREGFLGPSISNYTQLWAGMQIKGYIKKYHGIPEMLYLPYMSSICNRCKTKLIPIVYGVVSQKTLDLSEAGLILLGGSTLRSGRLPNSYCPLCEEAFDNVTDMPLGIPPKN